MLQRRNSLRMRPQQLFNHVCPLVTAAQPNYPRRRTDKGCQVGKIRIEGNQGVTVCLGKIPDRAIVRTIEVEDTDLARFWKEIRSLPAKFEAQILIKTAASFGSGRHTALAIGRVGEAGADILLGQFRVIGDNIRDILAASQPNTSATVIRIPRMQGRPPRLPGSIVIISR